MVQAQWGTASQRGFERKVNIFIILWFGKNSLHDSITINSLLICRNYLNGPHTYKAKSVHAFFYNLFPRNSLYFTLLIIIFYIFLKI